ncbi:MAG: hypothetical protein AB8E15_00740 [Bdellovibrionales bacterium]
MRNLVIFAILGFSCVGFSQRIDLSSGRTQKVETQVKRSSTGLGMRALRRVGIGVLAQGELGFGGLQLEINPKPEWSIQVGYGGGPEYRAFSFQYKRILSGESFLPYFGLGISRWFNDGSGAPISRTNPGVLVEKLMSDSDKANGTIDELLLTGKLGIQYMTLKGPWIGYAFHADVQLLFDAEDFIMAPTASFGLNYYF